MVNVRLMRPRTLGPIVLLTLATGSAVGELAQSSGTRQTPTTSSSPPPEQADADAQSSVGSVDASIESSFRVFRRDRDNADQIAGHTPTLRRAAVTLSRRVATTSSGEPYFAVPRRGALCMVAASGSGGCSSIADAKAGAFVLSLCGKDLPRNKMRISGLLSDDVTAAGILYADGSTGPISMGHNGFVFDAVRPPEGALPVALELQRAGHATKVGFDVPPGIASQSCGSPTGAPVTAR